MAAPAQASCPGAWAAAPRNPGGGSDVCTFNSSDGDWHCDLSATPGVCTSQGQLHSATYTTGSIKDVKSFGYDDRGQAFCCSSQITGNITTAHLYGSCMADTINNYHGSTQLSDLTVYAYGNEGNDTITGSTAYSGYVEWLYGGDGADTINGRAGADNIYGEAEADVLTGGAGADTMYGGGGMDTLQGGSDGDTMYGEGGIDYLYGQEGSDTMSGGDDADFLYGAEDDDWMEGGAGADYISGESGDDTAYGGTGDDIIYLGDGENYADAGIGDDYVCGGSGPDEIWGGADYDRLYSVTSGGPLLWDYIYGGTEDDVCGSQNGDNVGISSCDVVVFAICPAP